MSCVLGRGFCWVFGVVWERGWLRLYVRAEQLAEVSCHVVGVDFLEQLRYAGLVVVCVVRPTGNRMVQTCWRFPKLNAVPRWSANGGGSVSVAESHALVEHAVEVWSAVVVTLGFRVHLRVHCRGKARPSEIVGKNKQEIWRGARLRGEGGVLGEERGRDEKETFAMAEWLSTLAEAPLRAMHGGAESAHDFASASIVFAQHNLFHDSGSSSRDSQPESTAPQ